MSKFKGIGINPELPVVLIITFLLLLGGALFLFSQPDSKFNFYSSKIVVDGQNIQEELHYNPDKDYHTLYRNFESEIYSINKSDIYSKNYFLIKGVKCSHGNYYFKDYYGNFYPENYPYTENNEYGCTFGDVLGFSKGNDYIINAEYEIHPENLFKINNNYYIKFVAYSPGNHIMLTNENFEVYGEVVKDEKYFENQNVILYIPYFGETSSFNIIELKDFDFDSDFKYKIKYLLFFFPGILFFLVWFIFGKENTYESVPRELSSFPTKRVFWEVAAYFNPPFSRINQNFFAATLLNFYNKKIIDIKEKDKEIYIKLNKFKGDDLEMKIYNLLVEAEKLLKEEMKKGPFSGGYLWKKDKKDLFDEEYFNLKKAMMNPNLRSIFLEINEYVKEKGKKYINNNHAYVILVVSLFIFFTFVLKSFFDFTNIFDLIYAVFILLLFLTIPLTQGTLFSKYKENNYIEYQKWKSFKRYLKNSFSIKTATHKTVVIWNEYLVYATALGVPKRVIEELKANNLIDERQVSMYNGVILASSASFSSASGGAGGGFGGAGGGGAGGGGGGGR
ncbi:MAG TPA: DUF2207 domain-containing protein [Candidatus Pacearchaeota archaeon]|nr:DUF2207 domain-containing protein [Candidatus Pacearchaeota archaeon]